MAGKTVGNKQLEARGKNESAEGTMRTGYRDAK